jgi:hypothetical protein
MNKSAALRVAVLAHSVLPSLVMCHPHFARKYSDRSRRAAFVPPTQLRSLLHRQHRAFAIDNAMRTSDVPLFMTPSDSISSFAAPSSSLPLEVSPEQLSNNLQIEQLSPTTTIIVFLIGIIPFLWATYEFWRRIAVGASFGTGSDSVVIPSPFKDVNDDLITIGEDNNPNSSRGRRTLDKGALTVAYVLFTVAGGSVAIAIASVLMSPQPPL